MNASSAPRSAPPAGSAARGALVLYLALFFVAWLALPIALHEEPPDDNFEQLRWAAHPALGYDKHPPLPTWILWVFERAFPGTIELTYFLGALQVAVMLGCLWGAARELLGPARAWRAALLGTFVTYYTLRMHFYNHNSVLLAATALSMLALVRALRADRAVDWALLGACWGLGMLAKYQMAVGIACNALAILAALGLQRRALRALLLAALTAAVVCAPHGAWLVANDFPPLHYAAKFVGAALPVGARFGRVLSFSADQLLRIVPMLVLIGALAFAARGEPPASRSAAERTASRILALHALGPLVSMAGLGLFAGTDLEMHWGTAYLWAIPAWVLTLPAGRRIAALPDGLWLRAAALLQAILVVGSAVQNWPGR